MIVVNIFVEAIDLITSQDILILNLAHSSDAMISINHLSGTGFSFFFASSKLC